MALDVKFEPINRNVLVSDLAGLDDQEVSQQFGFFAEEMINDAKAQNARALGFVPPFDVFVDGRKGGALTSVKPNGVIFVEFQLILPVLEFIGEELVQHSPVKTGTYEKSHIVLADGVEVGVRLNRGLPLDADEYIFVNSVPYARKIERGQSSQAPDGVYQVVATLARRQFSHLASITFSYRTIIGGKLATGKLANRSEQRNPAIVVTARRTVQ